MLVDLYLGTGGNAWSAGSRTNWLSEQPMGQWAGVTTEGGYVTGLDLGAANLAGPFPERLGELTRLRSANLRGNSLTGCIPYDERLRNALSDSYQSGRGAGKEPDYALIVLEAIYNVLIVENNLEYIRDPELGVGWEDFMERDLWVGAGPLPAAGLPRRGLRPPECRHRPGRAAGHPRPLRGQRHAREFLRILAGGAAARLRIPTGLAGREPERRGPGGEAMAGRAAAAWRHTGADRRPGSFGGVEPVQERAHRLRPRRRWATYGTWSCWH